MPSKQTLSRVEISRIRLIENIKNFRNLVSKDVKLSVAIKGNAYGHGQNEITKILEPYVDYFQVDDLSELVELRKLSKKKAFVFGYVDKYELRSCIKLGCVLSLFNKEQILDISNILKGSKVVQEIHLPVDAFLGREGFLLSDLPDILKQIKKQKNIRLTGVYAHFANIEDTSDFSHAQKQIKEYSKILKIIKENGFQNIETHISATSGILLYEKGDGVHKIVRLGIGVYGLWPSRHIKSLYKNKFTLLPVLSWKTKVAQIKILPKGSTVGYGLTYKTNKKTKIAIIPQGYADGLDRKLSNNGEVLIRNSRCKIIGRVSMNMCTVEVTHLSKVNSEDEVVILGRQGREEITAEEMAEKINTINYEVVTRINPLLPRVIC
jgi:alanine racemase